MKKLMKDAVQNGMSYSEYNALCKQLVLEGKTTGESTEEKIAITKLNLSRTTRLDKTLSLSREAQEAFRELSMKQYWLVIAEPWCADGAQTLPVLNKIAEVSENITLKILLRDDHPVLMDAFLTNGARAIPKLIVLDEELRILFEWGPRSKAATMLVNEYKSQHGKIDEVFKKDLQVWYNKDRGHSIIKDLLELEAEIQLPNLKAV